MTYDLILRGGRLLDPGTGRDEVTDVAFSAGCIAATGAGLQGEVTRHVAGCIVMPGNIDFHTHV
jgi:predicted amidohydrolase